MMVWPTFISSPCFTEKFNGSLSNKITVEPIWKRPTSSPCLKKRRSSVLTSNRGAQAVDSQIGLIPATSMAPTRISAICPLSVPNLHTRRSLRARRLGRNFEVLGLTEKSSPGI